MCHVLSCLYVSVGHNPTQDVTMATAAVLDEPSNMECTVCHEHLTLPKLLPCGHLLCRHCLVSWLKSQPEANCPLCRSAIVNNKKRKGRSLENIADGFPTDLAMAALVEADRLLSKQHACRVCVNEAAVSMCLTCMDMFCQSCSTMHKKQSVTEHHKVESLASLTAEKLAANRPATCAIHGDEMSKLCLSRTQHGRQLRQLCTHLLHPLLQLHHIRALAVVLSDTEQADGHSVCGAEQLGHFVVMDCTGGRAVSSQFLHRQRGQILHLVVFGHRLFLVYRLSLIHI